MEWSQISFQQNLKYEGGLRKIYGLVDHKLYADVLKVFTVIILRHINHVLRSNIFCYPRGLSQKVK